MNNTNSLGKLYLIPVTMGECDPMDVLPQTVKRTIEFIDYYIVENEKTARKSIKAVLPEKKQSELVLFALNKHTDVKEHLSFIQPLLAGKNMGLMSEAGCPGVADPGAVIVKLAHEKGIQVIIAGAGAAAHLPGMVASMSPLPVIGVPVKSSNSIDGWDSVLSILQMPGGVPVATVALNGAKNAGILAAQIIGTSDKCVLDKIIAYKQGLKETVIKASEGLKK